jgi:hypothetical protein
VLARPWLGVGNVVVIAAAGDAPLQTLDLSQLVPAWKASNGSLAPSVGAVATGVHPAGHVIERLGDSLVDVEVPTS